MSDLLIYSTPAEADVSITLDNGQQFVGVPCSAYGRDDAHRITLPSDCATQGAVLSVIHTGKVSFSNRGILAVSVGIDASFILDDVRLIDLPQAPATIPPNPHADPTQIIGAVFNLGDHDMTTKDGCGEFTHDCCLNLHAQHSGMWGHIRKSGAQNQWDGHAVDALMLLAKAGATDAGIYDIIHDSESPNATPSFNWKGAPDPNLWMDPAEVQA